MINKMNRIQKMANFTYPAGELTARPQRKLGEGRAQATEIQDAQSTT